MRREPEALSRGPFDLLILGGGIYGAWTAYDAALRGLRVLLVERTDWGAGTSSASSKLVHGGLRYLRTLQLGLVRKSLRERRRLLLLGPHQVRPLPFAVPLYRGDRPGRLALRAGLTLYDALGGGAIGRHRWLRRDALLAKLPFLEAGELRGGFTYGDCGMDDARLVLEIVDGAIGAGAAAVNRVEALDLLLAGGRVRGARVRDRESGETREVEAAVTVNSAGPWAGSLGAGAAPALRLIKGVHLVLPGLGVRHAVLLTARSDGRVFFLIPWYGRTLLGTTDSDYHGDPDDLRVEPAEADYLLREAGRAMGRSWDGSQVLGCFTGLRALQRDGEAIPSRATREWSLQQPAPGLLVPVGGKYTSARVDAAGIVDRVMAILGRAASCATAARPFPWRPEGPFPDWLARAVQAGEAAGLDAETARRAAQRFGARVTDLHRILQERPELAARLHPDLPFCRAEVVHAVRDEMAGTLSDILRRRIPLTILATPDEELLASAAELAGGELGWDAPRRAREVRSVREGMP